VYAPLYRIGIACVSSFPQDSLAKPIAPAGLWSMLCHWVLQPHASTTQCGLVLKRSFVMESIAPNWLWAFFVVSVLVALFVDFVVLKKQGAHEVTVPEAF
jgi:hypothetical protein